MKESDLIVDESLSALMDGDAVGAGRAQALAALLADPAAQKQWHTYHMVGDVMRSADLAPEPSGLAFLERLQVRLAAEPGLQVAESAGHAPALASGLSTVTDHATQSANAGAMRWGKVSGALAFATCAVITVILWSGAAGTDADTSSQAASAGSSSVVAVATALPAAPIASASTGQPGDAVDTAVVASPEAQVMLRDPELDALLSAHRAMGGNSALQLPSGFLRNATFERPNR